MLRTFICSLAALALAAASFAQVRINEMSRDVPGSDDTLEFVELKGAPGTSLDGLWLLVIEGDNSSNGLIDQAIPLTGQMLGANGLLLIRDNALVLNPTPDPLTNVFVIDFAPDIENGSASYAIVRDYSGYVINANTNPGQNNVVGQNDIDSDNNGVMGDWGIVTAAGPITTPGGSQPWTDAIDSFGWLDNTSALDSEYGNQILATGISFGTTIGRGTSPITFIADTYWLSGNGLVMASDIETTPTPPTGGPYFFDIDETEAFNCNVDFDEVAGLTLTPGSANPAVTEIVAPDNFNIDLGLPFGGDLESLKTSDENKLFILSDENEPNATLTVEGTACGIVTSSYGVNIEVGATREDLSIFVEAVRTNNTFVAITNGVSTLADQTISGTLTSGLNDLQDSAGKVKVRVRWIPQADLEAADGWSEAVDFVEFRLK